MKSRLIKFLKKLLGIKSPTEELYRAWGCLTKEQLAKLDKDLYDLSQNVKVKGGN